MSIPTIQIHQQYAQLGIQTVPGKLEIQQPQAAYEMHTEPPKLQIHSPKGELYIDQSRARDALGVGNNLETMHRIYSEARNVALQGIARIVENGNRLAAIHLKTNAIADIAQEHSLDFFEFDFQGEPSFDNVDIQYIAHKPEIEVIEGSVNLMTHPNRPIIQFQMGKVNYSMQQYAKVEITPPQIDLKL